MTKLLKINEICSILGVSRSTIWRWVRNGTLPAPIALSSQQRRWTESDVAAFVRERVADR